MWSINFNSPSKHNKKNTLWILKTCQNKFPGLFIYILFFYFALMVAVSFSHDLVFDQFFFVFMTSQKQCQNFQSKISHSVFYQSPTRLRYPISHRLYILYIFFVVFFTSIWCFRFFVLSFFFVGASPKRFFYFFVYFLLLLHYIFFLSTKQHKIKNNQKTLINWMEQNEEYKKYAVEMYTNV